jgi:hypothetical protein
MKHASPLSAIVACVLLFGLSQAALAAASGAVTGAASMIGGPSPAAIQPLVQKVQLNHFLYYAAYPWMPVNTATGLVKVDVGGNFDSIPALPNGGCHWQATIQGNGVNLANEIYPEGTAVPMKWVTKSWQVQLKPGTYYLGIAATNQAGNLCIGSIAPQPFTIPN